MNATTHKFGYPDTLIAEYDHWLVLLRPAQPTAGSLVLAAKSDATAFGALDPAAYTELGKVTAAIEAALKEAVQYERINYLMLMMVDPHVHCHVIPRYERLRMLGGIGIEDSGWPGPPNLAAARVLEAFERDALRDAVKAAWPR